MSSCATCGRPRTGAGRYCAGCGAEFSAAPDAAAEVTETAGAPVVPDGDAPAAPPTASADLTRWDTRWYKPNPAPQPAQPGPPGEPGGYGPASYASGQGPYGPGSAGQGPYSPGSVGQGPYSPGSAGQGPYSPGSAGQGSYGAVPPGAGPSGSPPPSPRRGGSGILIALLVILLLAVGGGAFALVSALTGHKTTPQSSGQPTGTGPGAPASATPGTGTTGASASATATASPAGSVGTATVTVAAGAQANPAAPQVQALLERYFSAINAHDYAAYNSLLDAQEQAKYSQSSFDSGYATTQDSAETLTSIADTGGGTLAATVSFTSHQSPSNSMNNSSCTAWTITLYLQPQGSGYLIGAPPASYHPIYQNCP